MYSSFEKDFSGWKFEFVNSNFVRTEILKKIFGFEISEFSCFVCVLLSSPFRSVVLLVFFIFNLSLVVNPCYTVEYKLSLSPVTQCNKLRSRALQQTVIEYLGRRFSLINSVLGHVAFLLAFASLRRSPVHLLNDNTGVTQV